MQRPLNPWEILVRPCNQLKNIQIPPELVPNVIDELPILALLATQPLKDGGS